MGTLISAETLDAMLEQDDVFVVDCRFSLADETAGYRLFQESHLPGAQYLDLNRDMSAPVVPGKTGRHPLPGKADFAAALGRLGIGNTSSVVAYDDATGAFAARLWWLMRWLGHEDVAVLDGGFEAWVAAGYDVTDEAVTCPRTHFEIRAPLTRTVEADEVAGHTGLLLDARDRARYAGESEPIDAVAGHIPGAVCAPFMENMEQTGADQDRPRMKSRESLRVQFESLGASDASSIICYCGSGVTATHTILALVHAGFSEPALYPGSWSEWITDPDRPVERG